MLSRQTICSSVIILFHLVGLVGFLTPALHEVFIKLVPAHLLLMISMLAISGYDRSSNILWFALGVYTAGFLVEVAGVNTGLIFGSYAYGGTLGIKLWNTPILIGVNWLLLVYSTGVFLSAYRLNKYVFALLGAIILVGIDYLIEPVAVNYDYWSWANAVIPLQNYFGWFVVSFLMFIWFNNWDFKKQNSSGVVLFVAQICFFIILNIWGT